MARTRPDVTVVLTGLAALSCPAALFVTTGPLGAAAGIAAVLVWVAAPVYGFAVGQFGLITAIPEPTISTQFLVAQASLLALLVLGLVRRRQSALGVVVFIVTASMLVTGVLVGVVWRVDTSVIVAGLVIVVAAVVYALHRYELVLLGLTEPNDLEGS